MNNMEEKVLITNDQDIINEYLNMGWRVKMVIAQQVSNTNHTVSGKFLIVLERSF